jgi:hypothetical protein
MTTYDSTIILPFGTRVKMTSFDPHGLQGRDLHPTEGDLGFEGVIVKNSISTIDGDYRENLPPGTPAPEESAIVYWVLDSDGKTLELGSDEIDPV